MINRKRVRFLLVSLLFLILLFSFMGESSGFYAVIDFIGLDQNLYQHVSAFFLDDIFDKAYNGYQLQRVFPFAFINALFHLLEVPINETTLTLSMIVCNVLAVVASVYVFFRISSYHRWKIQTEIVAFSFIFYNIHTLSVIGFTPFNTDEFALLLSMIMFFSFIQGKIFWLLCCGIIGAFVWPTLLITSLVLAFIPKEPVNMVDCKSTSSFPPIDKAFLRVCKFGAMMLPLAIGGMTFYKYPPNFMVDDLQYIYSGDWFNYNYVNVFIVAVSTVCLMFFIYRMLLPLNFEISKIISNLVKHIKLKDCLIACGLYLFVKVIIWSLQNDAHYWDVAGMLKHTVLRSTALPFIFLEAHFLYFGIITTFLLFNWKKAIVEYSQLGLGYMVVIGMFIVLCVNPESRYMIFLLPFVAIPFMNVVDKWDLKRWLPIAAVLSQLLLSRFWISMRGDYDLGGFLPSYFVHYDMNGHYNGAFQHLDIYIGGTILFLISCLGYMIAKKKKLLGN